MFMKQLLLRFLVPALLLALILILTSVVANSQLAAEAAEPAAAPPPPALSETVEVDPAMHAFFAYYLNHDWKLPVEDACNLATWVLKYSSHYQTDPMVQLARVLKESRGRHYRSQSNHSPANVVRGGSREIGFSQIMPFWAGKQVQDITISKDMLYDPEGNIRAGIALYKRYETGGNPYLLALARYNRPGSRRPNSYARGVDRIYQDIKRDHAAFAALQPAEYFKRVAVLADNLAIARPLPKEVYF
jgi:soluble lytic murein transglycosylase-like protein